jgi:hypothetical protein
MGKKLNMINSRLLENLKEIKSKRIPTEESINQATHSDRLQIEKLQIDLEQKKQRIIKDAEDAARRAQESYFKERVIANDKDTMQFIESAMIDFLEGYASGQTDLKESILYYNRVSPPFVDIEKLYPGNIRWILEYIASVKNGTVASVPRAFMRSRLPDLLLEQGIVDVLVERTWLSDMQEWCEPDYGSLHNGSWYTTTVSHYEIMLIKEQEFHVLSKFDKSKTYRLINSSLQK